MAFEKGYALLIGVGTYLKIPAFNIPMTAADAQQVADVLRDPRYCGYPEQQVKLLHDVTATRDDILQTLDAFAARVAKDDTLFLFYSGHGHYGDDGTYYLTTYDTALTTGRKVATGTGVSQAELLAKLQSLKAERVLLIFNACHAGAISPTLHVGTEPFSGSPLPAQTAAALLSTGSGRAIITACREDQFAYVGSGTTTIFTEALLAGLQGRGVSSQRGFISVFDLYTHLYFTITEMVQHQVPAAIRQRYSETQEPELTVLKGVGPFAVALYRGASAAPGEFSAPAQPAEGTAMREISPAYSRIMLQKILGIQQTQTGGINFGVGTTIEQMGDVIAGDKIAGDKIDVHNSPGFVNRPTAPVTQIFQAAEQAYDVRGLECPYIGLRSFSYQDRGIYAGRERTVEKVVDLITEPGHQRSLLFITGASGSGKSSFAQAGLILALEQHYEKLGLEVQHAVFRPLRQPLAGLAVALLQLGRPADGVFAAARPFMLGMPTASPPNSVYLLVIDQFEELFTQSDPAQCDALFAILTALPPFTEVRIHIIATLRADYLPELFRHAALYDIAKQGVDLRAMSVDELKDAIQKPLQQRYPDGSKRFEDELLTVLAQDATGDAAFLPLLQVTLEDLWRRGSLTRRSYGHLTDAIRQRADDVYTYIDYDSDQRIRRNADDQMTIMAIFLDLISVSLDDDARRDVRRRRDATALVRASDDRRRLIDDLVNARLLSKNLEVRHDKLVKMRRKKSVVNARLLSKNLEVRPDKLVKMRRRKLIEVVDIIHETLIANWDKLRDEIKDKRTVLQQSARFEQALLEWEAHDGSDDYLLVGVRLAEAEDIERRGGVALQSDAAKGLLLRSRAAREAEQQRELARLRALAEEQRLRLSAERRLRRRQRDITIALSVVVLIVSGYLGWLVALQLFARSAGHLRPIAGNATAFEQYEVTNQRYALCVSAGRCTPPLVTQNSAYYATTEMSGTLPVTGVDALQATAFCRWIGRRLPTEPEWRYAAGLQGRTDWPAEVVTRLVHEANFLPDGPDPHGFLKPAEGSARSTPDGIADLFGNALEWTRTATNDTGAPVGEWDGEAADLPRRLVALGGSYRFTRTAYSGSQLYTPDYSREDLGIRCVE